MRRCWTTRGLVVWAAAVITPTASASLHLMQIEQVIGGVNGDTTAQAIQLRMRAVNQCLVSGGRLMANDASGLTSMLVVDCDANLPNCAAGDRVLIATQSFLDKLDQPIAADFILTNPLPASFLTAGSIVFQTDSGSLLYWRLSWGGDDYSGPNNGSTVNDADGDFGPPFPGVLPTDNTDMLRFDGPHTAMSTNNTDDYILDLGGGLWINNAGETAALVTKDACLEDLTGDGDVNAADLAQLLGAWGTDDAAADLDNSGAVDAADLATLLGAWGPCLD